MIRRFYVHNFRCLENFELRLEGLSSVLLIGKNGSGKTTVASALEVLQKIGRGVNRVEDLVSLKDLPRNHSDAGPLRIELEVEVQKGVYAYRLAFDMVGQQLRVREEEVSLDGRRVYVRDHLEIKLAATEHAPELRFPIEERLVALPIVQSELLLQFKLWLNRILILRPQPSLINGDSNQSTSTLLPNINLQNFGDWFSGVLALRPSVYLKIQAFLEGVMPDFSDIQNPQIGKDARTLVVQFSKGSAKQPLFFGELSDGEKCFVICAVVLAANEAYGPLLCYWDEPDNFLSLDEVGHFVMALRSSFRAGGQFIATSHNPEAIRAFSDEDTFFLHRHSHLEPAMIRPLGELEVHGDLVGALIRGDVEP